MRLTPFSTLIKTQFALIVLAATIGPLAHSAESNPPPIESLKLTASTDSWSSAALTKGFSSPIVVCTPQYYFGAPPAVVRVRSVVSGRFEFRLARLDSVNRRHSATIHCVAAEEGIYNEAQHGIKMEAQSFRQFGADRADSFTGRRRRLANSYDRPVVLGQVMTSINDRFAVFWSTPNQSNDRIAAPFGVFYAGMHVGEDPEPERKPESIGYIVFEAGSGQIGGLSYEAGHIDTAPNGYPAVTRSLGFSGPPSSAVLSAWSMHGANGGFPVLAGLGQSSISVFFDEDQLLDAERIHIGEQVAYLAFSSSVQKVLPPKAPPPPSEVTLSLSPATADVQAGKSVSISASVKGDLSGPLEWSISPQIGSLATSAAEAVYLAPRDLGEATRVTVMCKSVVNPSIAASALLLLTPSISVSVNPTSVTLSSNDATQLSATVTGTPNQAVTWSLNPRIGEISTTGTYRAPSDIQVAAQVQATAQSAQDRSKAGTSVINLEPAPRGVEFEINENQLTALSYRGVSFYARHANMMRGAFFRAKDGSMADVGWSNGWINPAERHRGEDWFEHVFNPGGNREFAVRVKWETIDPDTLRATATVINRDEDEDLVGISLLFLPFTIPGPAREHNHSIPIEVGAGGVPVGFLSGDWGSVAFWHDHYPSAVRLRSFFTSPSQTKFDVTLSISQELARDYAINETIPPQSSREFHYYLRFSDTPQTAKALAPEAHEAFRAGYPSTLDWQDRRPIATWFISEGTKRSHVNPRGYLWDSNLDASSPTFRTKVLAKTDEIIARMNGMGTRPQGIIVWDLEGQEFNHAFTYVGAPDKLKDLAPEMDAVADEVFARFSAAGYLPGLTIRPQDFGTGTTLPATCSGERYPWGNDKFVKTDAVFPHRSFRCTEEGKWEVTSAGPGAQKDFKTRAEVKSILQRKIRYAKNRWGVKIFYVDSSVYGGGGPFDFLLWRELSAEFPDTLFIPELETWSTHSSSAPYNEARMGVSETRADILDVYPNAFSILSIADVDYQENWQGLVDSIRSGNVPLMPVWWSDPQIRVIQELYREVSSSPMATPLSVPLRSRR